MAQPYFSLLLMSLRYAVNDHLAPQLVWKHWRERITSIISQMRRGLQWDARVNCQNLESRTQCSAWLLIKNRTSPNKTYIMMLSVCVWWGVRELRIFPIDCPFVPVPTNCPPHTPRLTLLLDLQLWLLPCSSSRLCYLLRYGHRVAGTQHQGNSGILILLHEW